jgi:surfeit locus 1 family protein
MAAEPSLTTDTGHNKQSSKRGSGHREVRVFQFNWKLTLFTVLMLPLLIYLGLWQLQREQEKRETQVSFDLRAAQAPVSLEQIDWQATDAIAWRRIEANGRYDPPRQFLLDNRINQSRVGYEVITPFQTDSGLLLVNRGWIAQGVDRQTLPDVSVTDAEVVIQGAIYVPGGDIMVLGAEEPPGREPWPRVVQTLDLAQMATLLGEPVLPYSVRLEPGAPGLRQINWQPVTLSPETHRAYAVQWFFMAVVLVILFLIFSFRRPEI